MPTCRFSFSVSRARLSHSSVSSSAPPENFYCFIRLTMRPTAPPTVKKAVQVRKHLERNRHDKDSKFRLILIESRIHRLARYYRTKGQLPPTFKVRSRPETRSFLLPSGD